jgi:molecular chaperone GrpE
MMRSTDDDDSLGPVVRDRRRIDPVTGQVRDTGQPGAAGSDQARSGPAQSGSAQSGSAQSGPAQSGSAQSGPAQSGPAQSGSARGRQQSKPGKHSASRPGGQSGTAQSGTAQSGGARDATSRGAAGTGDRAGASLSAGESASAAGDGRDGRGAPLEGTAGTSTAAADPTAAAARLAERTADLQRLQAEYANYRKRVERDRMAVREQALASVLGALLPILDDIGRAREHGELEGGFKSVAESLEAAAVKLGLTSYGEDGDPFDPNVHEALMHSYSDDVTEPTCVRILQPGYKVGDRILRPARVAVAEPGGGQDGSGPAGPAAPDPE